jgi:transcription elongation GreA/GreB family factor
MSVDQIIRFALDGEEMERKLVVRPDDESELSVESPVGAALLFASVGDKIKVVTPGGIVTIEVLGHA